MKKIVTALAATMLMSGMASASQSMELRTKAPTDVFTPKGFDSNDNVQVVLTGVLSNFCFHEAPAEFYVDPALKRVYVESAIYSFDRCQDAMMYIPYTQVLSLGVMSAGNYEVWASDGTGGYEKRADLPVARAGLTPFSPDDTRYAPVSEVQYIPAATGTPSIVIKGVMSNTCLRMGPVTVNVVPGNVVQVEPTALWVQGQRCMGSASPFTETVVLKGFPSQGDVLIHVRSMGGQAVNRVVTALDRGIAH